MMMIGQKILPDYRRHQRCMPMILDCYQTTLLQDELVLTKWILVKQLLVIVPENQPKIYLVRLKKLLSMILNTFLANPISSLALHPETKEHNFSFFLYKKQIHLFFNNPLHSWNFLFYRATHSIFVELFKSEVLHFIENWNIEKSLYSKSDKRASPFEMLSTISWGN